jgi:hypothetical protein
MVRTGLASGDNLPHTETDERDMPTEPNAPSDRVYRDIAILRDRMIAVHYYAESHWLAAAVTFPQLCNSPNAQDALRRAATIAWQFGYPAVSHWLNTTLLPSLQPAAQEPRSDQTSGPVRLPPAADWV